MSYHIEAVTVNHNTSSYMELMLHSLFARHSSELDMSIVVLDNGSGDDGVGLRAYTKEMGVPVVKSGFTTDTQNNSHGEILRAGQEHGRVQAGCGRNRPILRQISVG